MIGALISVFLTSLITWIILAFYFTGFQNIHRLQFIIYHYLVSLIATAVLFFILVRYFNPGLTPFWTMIVAMISFFIIEVIVFTFFYKEDLWFLTYVDWVIPVFIVATTVYFMAYYFG